MAAIIPIGMILPYAGAISESKPLPQGWLLCDGRELDKTTYADLFNVIGTTYGGKGIPGFCLPDLRGMFVRATDHGRHKDPDSGSRTSGPQGGSSGDNPGSLQKYSTAKPQISFATDTSANHDHPADHLPTEEYWAAAACTANHGAAWTSGSSASGSAGAHTHMVTGGGDRETRPQNICMNWIIKYMKDSSPAGTSDIEIGTVSSFAGDSFAKSGELAALGWKSCNGETLSRGVYASLFASIGNLYGGGESDFNLPDLRGLFVRGVSKPTDTGKVRDCTTAKPSIPFTLSTAPDHSHSAPRMPHESYIENACAGHSVVNYPGNVRTGQSGGHTHTIGGGDSETRPVNIYLDFIIKVEEK